jgi:hypothetical protein
MATARVTRPAVTLEGRSLSLESPESSPIDERGSHMETWQSPTTMEDPIDARRVD